ncbi:MAG: hypothetical protein ACOCVQ_01370 [Bacillota bacterium]
MIVLYAAVILIAIAVAVFLLRDRFGGRESVSRDSSTDFAAPRMQLNPDSRGRCPECGARRWPGSVKCWNCGADIPEK